MGIYDTFINQIDIAKRIYGSLTKLSKDVGIPRDTLSRWYNRTHIPRMDEVSKLCDALHLKLVHEDELRDNSTDNTFISIPVIKTKSVIRDGIIPEEYIESWVKVDREFESVLGKHNLIVYTLPKESDGIPKGSQVLIDRDIKDIEYGKYYLIQIGLHVEVRRLGQSKNGSIYYHDDYEYVCSLDSNKIIGKCIWIRCKI